MLPTGAPRGGPVTALRGSWRAPEAPFRTHHAGKDGPNLGGTRTMRRRARRLAPVSLLATLALAAFGLGGFSPGPTAASRAARHPGPNSVVRDVPRGQPARSPRRTHDHAAQRRGQPQLARSDQ